MVFSVVAPTTRAKAIRAMVTQSRKQLGSVELHLEDMGHRRRWNLSPEGYRCQLFNLGLGNWHVVAICRDPQLLLDDTDSAIWHHLERKEITTPRLRSWVPYLRSQLQSLGKLTSLYNVGTSGVYLSCDTELIDCLVSEGLALGHISIE